MSGPLLTFIELSLLFLVVFGWGFHELRSYRRYKLERARRARRAQKRQSLKEPAVEEEPPQPSANSLSEKTR